MNTGEDEDASRRDDAHDAAIEWWVLEKAGKLEGEQRAAFETWLASDPIHASAYGNIAGMFEHVRALRPPRRVAAPRVVQRWPAAAAGLLAASLALFAWFDDLTILLRADHLTGVGETKSVTLEDGSRVELDAGSAIALHFEKGRRRLTLLAGEAWFEVAPDAARPFVVEAAGGTVTALGTAFDVAVQKGRVRVAVGEHAVAVASGGESVVVDAKQETSFEPRAPASAPTGVAAENVAAWRRGALVVEDRPLGEALETLGRYRRGYVYCLRASTCARRVSGVFATGEPLRALREIEYFLGLHATYVTNYLIFLSE